MSYTDALAAADDAQQEIFGVTVTFFPADRSGPFTRSGIFDMPHVLVDGLGDAPISSSHPMLHVRAGDWSDVAVDDELTVDGDDYKIKDIQPDNQGLLTFLLEAMDD